MRANGWTFQMHKAYVMLCATYAIDILHYVWAEGTAVMAEAASWPRHNATYNDSIDTARHHKSLGK
jgi:hypothetical protein